MENLATNVEKLFPKNFELLFLDPSYIDEKSSSIDFKLND